MKNHIEGIYTAIYHVGQKPYFDQPFYVGFNVAGYELGVMPQAHTKRKTKCCVAYWGVKDIAAACETLQAKGHQLFEPVTDVGGGIKVASFLDADENIVGLIENPHFPNICGK